MREPRPAKAGKTGSSEMAVFYVTRLKEESETQYAEHGRGNTGVKRGER